MTSLPAKPGRLATASACAAPDSTASASDGADVVRSFTKRSGRRAWTAEEERALLLRWGSRRLDTIARDIDRTPLAVYARAHKLGLTREGLVLKPLHQLARACGVERGTLRKILVQAGVRPGPDASDPRRRARRRFSHVRYDEARALQVFQAWTQTETLSGAARARGHDDEWMKRRLQRAGLHVAKAWHRYPTHDIDRAIAEFAPDHSCRFVSGEAMALTSNVGGAS